MNRAEAVAALKAETDAVKAPGAASLFIFGSVIRDEAGVASDLDLFIDYDRDSRFSLVELAGIQHLLERRLGLPVDLTTRDSLDPLLRGHRVADAIIWNVVEQHVPPLKAAVVAMAAVLNEP